MPYITKEVDPDYSIYYEDFGDGQPVILIHGWPLSSKSWEPQLGALLDAGYRVITYDRRGFGKSQPTPGGYDYNSLSDDLLEVISYLDLQNVVLVGFSMGGGEVVRFLTNHGSEKVNKVALIASIIPLVKQKEDNPDGVPESALNEILENLKKDRVTFLEGFHKNFYGYGFLSQTVSQAQLNYDWSVASQASPLATIKCAESWANTDFRPELKNVTVPTLIVHGDADKVVPIKTAGEQAAKGIANNQFVVVEGGSHGLNVTHAEELNEILLNFLRS